MLDALAAYEPALIALGAFGFLYLVQLLVADVIGIRSQHVPGTPVQGGHEDMLFRATRAHANTTESVGAVILLAAFAIGVGGDPAWVNGTLWTFFALRVVHMLAYYLDVRILRSVAFGLGMVTLLVLFGVGFRAAA